MRKFKCLATANFGVEAIVKRELEKLVDSKISILDGRVYFEGSLEDIYRANLWLRCAERVHIQLADFKATSFEELYQGVYQLPWGDILPKDANFMVQGRSAKSKLFSVSDCQRITERALIDKLNEKYSMAWYPKTGARYKIEVILFKDQAQILLDTSADGLHKRGYRVETVEAPLTETLAAALVDLSYYNKDRVLWDPFCGSGTIAIEACMKARNIAPGLNRHFDCEYFQGMDKDQIKKISKEAFSAIDLDTDLQIFASDKSAQAIGASKKNAEAAGVDMDINFIHAPIESYRPQASYGVLITNPPYGHRIGSQEDNREIYETLKKYAKADPTWSYYLVTSDEDFPKAFGKKPSRKRKLYNGRIKVDYYQYYGPRPPRDEKE